MTDKKKTSDLIEKAFGMVYDYRNQLIKNEEYEEVIALDKLIKYVRAQLES